MRTLLVMVSLVAMVAGCSDSSNTPADSDIIEVSFDGTECSVNPSVVQAGERAFLITNTSDVDLDSNNFFVPKVPSGYTFQDLVDIQIDNGGPPKSIPEDIWYGTLAIREEVISFAALPVIALNDDQWLEMRTLTPGTDAIEFYVEKPEELQWLCGPLEVTTDG